MAFSNSFFFRKLGEADPQDLIELVHNNTTLILSCSAIAVSSLVCYFANDIKDLINDIRHALDFPSENEFRRISFH